MKDTVLIKIGIIIGIVIILNILLSIFFNFIKKKRNGIHIGFLSGLIKVVIIIIASISITNLFHSTSYISRTLLTSSGILVAVIGFAAQQVLSDVLSGLMLSWAKPFDVGEKITIQDLGISGIVDSMSLRHTIIKTYQNTHMIVPNSVINKSVIENSNFENSYVGNYIEVIISYESDLEKAIEIMKKVINNCPFIIDTRINKDEGDITYVQVKDLSDHGVILKSLINTKDINDNFNACSEIRKNIKLEFDKAKIKFGKLYVLEEKSVQ